MKAFGEIYKKRFPRQSFKRDKHVVIFLGDNPKKRLCWSPVKGRIPTLRRNTGKLFQPHRHRWMVGRERLATLGFPVCPEIALSMCTPMLPVRDPQSAAQVAGIACILGAPH